MVESDWTGLYGESWTGIIVPEAFSHPAKYSRGLILRIFRHAVDEGWLRAGDTVVDPFSGTSLGAWAALPLGINFVGNELERPFHDLSMGVDCTGVSRADWVRFYGRADKARYLGGRHWCPRCMAQVGIILPPKSSQLEMFPEPSTVSYRRDSGIIPHTEPHRYAGNLELFARHARNGAQAVCLLGDSRELAEVLKGAKLSGCISSPPFLGITPTAGDPNYAWKFHGDQSQYGTHPAQLGNMREGELGEVLADAVISSPPWQESLTTKPEGDYGRAEHGLREDGTRRGGSIVTGDYGCSEGQLAAMPASDAPTACISSPPYAGTIQEGKDGSGIDWSKQADRKTSHPHGYKGGGYGSTPGNLAQLPEGDAPAACISSPPWENQIASMPNNDSFDFDIMYKNRAEKWGRSGSKRDAETQARLDKARLMGRDYGNSPNQLGQESGDTFWSAAKAIVEQVYQVLAPGGHAVWITKRFVRDKKIVQFSRQWADLCESVGFVTVHWHRAWLVEDRGTQTALIGEDKHNIKKRYSFFRRLHSQKYPHLEIQWEDVICQMKP